jgi:hypothetical protein
MTTKAELNEGLRVALREGLRVMSGFAPDDWKRKVIDEGGTWTRKQAYAHLTSVAETVPIFVAGLASGGQQSGPVLDVDAFNAQMVASKDQLDGTALMAAYEAAYRKLIDFVEAMPGEQLQMEAVLPVTYSGEQGKMAGQVGTVLDGALVLHSLAHIYGAGGSPLS